MGWTAIRSPSHPGRTASMNRRSFLERGILFLAGGASTWFFREAAGGEGPEPALKIGLLADIHSADKDTVGNRRYRTAIPKVKRAIAKLIGLRADFLIELGDFIDRAPTAQQELACLQAIEEVYRRFTGPRHYVLGNHCVDTLTKEEFISHTGAEKTFYSFDAGEIHFIILDACFRADGVPYGRRNFSWSDTEIPPHERAWLQEDLSRTGRQTIAFVHQRLDLDPPSPYLVKSAAGIRKILEASGKVTAVIQGHNHLNDLRSIGGIHYITLPAVVDGPRERDAFALLEVFRDGSLRLTGFGETRSHTPGRLGAPRNF